MGSFVDEHWQVQCAPAFLIRCCGDVGPSPCLLWAGGQRHCRGKEPAEQDLGGGPLYPLHHPLSLLLPSCPPGVHLWVLPCSWDSMPCPLSAVPCSVLHPQPGGAFPDCGSTSHLPMETPQKVPAALATLSDLLGDLGPSTAPLLLPLRRAHGAT